MSDYLAIASANSFGRYNIKFANIVGLNTAVYWSCIMNILERVREKKAYDEDGFFSLNRSYVERQTALTKAKQTECDEALIKLGLLDIDETTGKMRCDMKSFFSLITEENQNEIASISRVAKAASKEGKAEGKKIGIINRLKTRIQAEDPELQQLYFNLLEVCYDKGLQKNEQIDLFQQEINNYTQDVQVKKDIIKIGIEMGYRVAEWCINKYESSRKPRSQAAKLGPQKKSDGVNTEFTF